MNINDIRNELIELYFESHNVSFQQACEIIEEMIDFGIDPIQFRVELIEEVKFNRRCNIVAKVYRDARESFKDFHDYLDWCELDSTRALIEEQWRAANCF